MTLQQFLRITSVNYISALQNYARPRIFCNDGAEIDIEAGAGCRSKPRNNAASHYEEIEVTYMRPLDTEIMPYEYQTKYTKSYGNVPVDLVQALIDKHGGINTVLTFETKI